MKSALLEFESNAFAAESGEEEHTNPGVFGKALATWLSAQLRPAGFVTGEVIAEDFGWCIPIESRPHSLYVVCSSDGESQTAWRVFVFAEGGLLQRLPRKDQRRSARLRVVQRGQAGPCKFAAGQRAARGGSMTPNPSLHPKCYSGLRPLPHSGELKR